MSVVYVTSDWHLGHKNICKFRDMFQTEEQHREFVLSRYMERVTKRDIVWFLGDIIFHPNYLQVVKDLPGTKKLVVGNHDTELGVDIADLCLVFDDIHGLVNYKHCWLSHAPIHAEELRGKWNVHGHTHSHIINDPRYYNACLEHTDYAPKNFQNILLELRERNATADKDAGC